MKLADHVEQIRQLIDKAFRNRFGRMGFANYELRILNYELPISDELRRIDGILNVFREETGRNEAAYEKLVEEFTFTLFNRLAALKVMEAHTLHPEIVTRRNQYGDRSFSHYLWLEENPDGRNDEMEGLLRFIEDQLTVLSIEIPLFSPQHPYHLLPTAIELNGIMNAFNQVETDSQVESEIWKSDDVLGWLYESYNNYKKAAHKESGAKTEYNKVSIQSQVYTPRWVVKFLVDNSLGKLYLEMFPDSEIKEKYKIANAPKTQTRERKPLTEIKMIDSTTGSGNFLLYGFDLFYDLYIDQIENYGAGYDESQIPELIIRHNLHGIDLDDRAVQLAQLGLYIKAKRKKRTSKLDHFNVVSSDFFLPEYSEVKHLFENGEPLSPELERIVTELWADLQQAYKFGSLIRLEEKFKSKLDVLVDNENKVQITFFSESNLDSYAFFRTNFFANLQKAVEQNTAKQGLNFLNTKTQDAITFLQLLTQKYDIAVANPPYTDSGNFGPELKKFIDDNYKKPYKFNANLYATFIKRNFELIDEKGKMALIHPLTFMYITTFEDVRKFIIEKLHINVFVDYGLSNLFGTVMVDPAFYVFEKDKTVEKAWFISLDQYTRTPQEKFKKDYCLEALTNYIENHPNKHNITLDQSKLKIIEGWPFIYWISDGFREKFEQDKIEYKFDVATGLQTGDTERFIRFWWEVLISENKSNKDENSKWYYYVKGGPFSKWHGNNWLVINWENNGHDIKKYKIEQLNKGLITANNSKCWNESKYLRDGITYSLSGSKGASFRFLEKNRIFDIAGPSIFSKSEDSIYYLLGCLNTNLILYIVHSLNPTVSTTPGDIKRIPFVKPSIELENNITFLASQNIEIKKQLCSYEIIESNFEKTPLTVFLESSLKEKLLAYFNFENAQLTQVLLNEAIINELIFEVYDLSPEDRLQVETKMGRPVGELPVLAEAVEQWMTDNGQLADNDDVKEFVKNLTITTFDEAIIREIKDGFATLYQSNNDLEEFCIRHQINPINIWYWFKEAKILPQARAAEIALEFLADAIRTILAENDDGIIPLVGLPEEPKLFDRLEKHCLDKGFTSAQFMQLDGLLGKPLNLYLEQNFFNDLSNHLNLFMYLPKTPFIWHLSSGEHQGLELYISIYRWSQDNLFRLKTAYISKRVERLEFRQIELAGSDTAQSQNEKEKIRLQLQEIAEFTKKIDELIAEGYNPILDDGVGKNIAPLQKKGMLKCDVLNKKQLEKYLNADW